MDKATEVFIYSAPEDEPMLQELLKHLQVFQQQNIITIWHNYATLAGSNREQEIEAHFNQAEYILLLLSPDFMNGDYGYSAKVQRALERQCQGTKMVIPVILRPVLWQETPFGKLQALPRGAIPITSEKWNRPDDAFYSVVEGLKQVLEKSGHTGTRSPLSTSVAVEQNQPPMSPAFILRHWGVFCVLISVTLSFNLVTLLQDDPSRLWVFLQRYPLLIVGVLLLTGGIPLFFLQKPKTPRLALKKVSPMGQSLRHVFTSIVIPLIVPAVTTTLFLTLLLLVLVRPAWCPSSLCAPTQTQIATNPDGMHDTNLDVSLVKMQSTSFYLPGNLHMYTLQNAPATIAAVRSDNSSASPFRLVIRTTNLHTKGYEIYIEHVEVVILAVPLLANPLNVWNIGSLTYNTNLYQVIYKGEPAGSVLDAGYEPVPNHTGLHQLLNPGEPDTIDLQIDPKRNLQADLLFQVRIIYRMSNEEQDHSLTLPKHFEVVFSTASNWHVHTF